jgi:O-antigen/teichoic acid export membrane protein
MNDKHTIFKNIGKNLISLSISQLVSRFLGAVVLLVLPRYLGPSDYGVYMTALSFFGIICIFAGFGLDGLFIKDVSRDHTLSQRYFSTNVVIKELLSFLLILVLGLAIYALSYPSRTSWAILTLATTIFFSSITTSYSAVFKAYEKMEYNAVLEISVNLIKMLGILIVIQLGGSILWIISIIVISQVAFSIIGYILINKIFFKVTWSTDLHFIIDSFKKSSPFFLVNAIAIIQFRLP